MNFAFIVPIVTIYVIAQTIAYKKESKLTDTLGVTCCGFILVLYILAFLRILSWVDYICVPILIAVIVWLVSNEELKICFQKFITVPNVIFFLFMIGLVVSQYYRIVTWPDDIAYWNIDLKQMWYLNGFAGKYGNAAYEYGDFPPAINLFKWFFAHMYQDRYIEGLGLAGYICLNFILLMPLTSRINELVEKKIILSKEKKSKIKVAANKKYVVSDKRLISKYKVDFSEGHTGETEQTDPLGIMILIFISIFTCFCLLLLPTIVNMICFEGTSPDVTMGIIYGMLLWSIWDTKIEAGKYYYARIAIYGSVLILCKSIGIGWAIMALVFLIVCYISRRSNIAFDTAAAESGLKYIIAIVISWLMVAASWVIYCVLTQRISRVTSEGLDLLQTKDLDIDFFLKANSFPFLQGFTIYPMHTNTSGILDLSVLIIFAVFVGMIVAYAKKLIITKFECVWLLVYIVLTAIVAYGVIFVGHLTIFAGEVSTGAGMAESLSVYSAPFVLGVFILVCGIWFDTIPPMEGHRPTTEYAVKEHIQAERLLALRIFYGAVAGFVLLCCDYAVVYNALGGYWTTRASVKEERASYISSDSRRFLSVIEGNEELQGKRVLYLRNTDRNAANVYISNEAAPVSVVYEMAGEGYNLNALWEYISYTNASFIYADDSAELNEFFDEICADGHQTNGLYRIVEDDKIEAYHTTVEYDYKQSGMQQ